MNSRSTAPQSDFWSLALRYCLSVFLPLALLVAAGLWFLLQSEQARLEVQLQMNGSMLVRLGADALVSQLQQIGGDVRHLARLESLAAALNQADSSNMARLAHDFQSFAEAKGIYDRLRWLDENGMERVQVDVIEGKGMITPDAALQDKSKHRYFRRAIALEFGQLYVSSLELNGEHGQAETPYKPTLYLATPLFDAQGVKRGIVLVNYHGEQLLSYFRTVSAGQNASLMLLNQDGYWLAASHATDEWGFVSGRTEAFAHRHPQAWRRILAQDDGQFHDADGLWTFATVYPLRDMQSLGDEAVVSPSSPEMADQPYAWKVVSHLSPERLTLDPAFLIRILSAGGVVLVLLGLGVARLAYLHRRQQQTALQLQDLGGRLSAEAEQRSWVEQALSRQNQLLQTILASIPVRVFWKDVDLCYLGGNAAFASDAGLSAPGMLIGQDDHAMPWREQAEGYRADDRWVIESGQAKLAYEELLIRPGGHKVWLQTSKVPLRNEQGEVMGVLGVYDDITALKETELQLRQLNRLYAVLDNINEAIVRSHDQMALLSACCRIAVEQGGFLVAWVSSVDPASQEIRVVCHSSCRGDDSDRLETGIVENSLVCGFVSHALRERETMVCNDVVHADDDTISWRGDALGLGCRSAAAFPITVAGQVSHVFSLCAGQVGFFDTVETRLLERLSGNISHAMESLANEAQRRQAVAELRISEERFDLALHASHEGLWDWDLNTDSVFYSSRWKAMLGYRDDELVNNHETWRRLVDPGDLSKIETLIRECTAGRQSGFAVEFRMRHKDGHWVDILSRGILVRDGMHHPKRLVGTHMDISERRQMEHDLSEAQRIAQVGYWRYEPSTDHLSWSDEVYRIFELDPMAFGATYECYLGMVHPADRAAVDREYQDHLKWNTHYRNEYRLLLPDGRVKHILSRCDTERDESGAALRSLGTVQDITREKETERRLRASEACVNHIIDAVPEVVLVVNQDGCIERVNARVEQIFGYERSELLGEVVEILIPHDFRDRHPVLRQRFSSEGRLAYRMGKGRELFGLHKDGHEIPVEIWLATLPEGSHQRVVVSIVDISDRKAAERALRDSEERLRLMTSSIRDYAIFMLDPQGLVVSWNEGAQRLKGYQAHEIIGQSVAQFHLPEEIARGRPAKLLKQAETEGYVEDTGWRLRKDGNAFFAEVIIAAIRDERGVLIGFSKITRDITERKVAEERLRIEREQQETLRTLLEICMSGTALEDTLGQCLRHLLAVSWLQPLSEGGIFLTDSKAQRLHLVVSYGLNADIQELCANVAWGDCHCGQAAVEQKIQYVPHMDEHHAITFLGMLDHGHYSVPIVFYGELMGVLVVALTMDFQREAVKEQFLGATADILASYLSRERAEREVAQQHECLEMLVAERTADLEKARYQAEQLARVKDNFLATMSHEIRTPMNAMLGMLELVGLHGLSERQARMLDMAQESGQSLLRIIDDILDYSKIEAGKLTIVAEPTSIAEIVQLAAAFYERLASGKSLVLVHAVSPEISPLVSVDRLRLCQILNNFLSNAIKFTEHGRVELRAELVERLPGVDRIRFTVVDTGVGIATEAQKLLFQPFSQADAETTRRFGGTGLGLAICRRLADMMNGDIELTSALGQGTTLSLTLDLPVLDVAAAQAAKPTVGAFLPSRLAGMPHPVAAASATGKLILLVDDHPTNRDLLTQQLEILGFASEQATGGIRALEMWKTREYDLLITDCHMPEVDGYQLVREIRRLEAKTGRQRMPVLAWTANALKESINRCLSTGMDDVLIKPANLDSLRAKLNQLFSTSSESTSAGVELPPSSAIAMDASQGVALDRSVLLELTGGDPEMENKILARFRMANQSDTEALGQALVSRDAEAIVRQAHRISGAAKMIGAQSLAQTCDQLEHLGQDPHWPDIEAVHVQYLDALVQLSQILDAL